MSIPLTHSGFGHQLNVPNHQSQQARNVRQHSKSLVVFYIIVFCVLMIGSQLVSTSFSIYRQQQSNILFSNMHDLLVRVLDHRELSRAGQLFNISDWDIVSDLHAALVKLKAIFNAPDYLNEPNTQSVVEICLARITSAIRETSTIETYAAGLVDMLQSCLQHDLTECSPTVHYSTTNYYSYHNAHQDDEAPYAKIASDLLSCLFLHYSNRSVMAVAIPPAIKLLNSAHRDLIRSTSSYLALAAIQSARLLSTYTLSIINSISKGNTSLMRVLPQIYVENAAPLHAHFPLLMKCMEMCDPAEKLSLLQLCSMVANTKAELLTSHIWQLRVCLASPQSCTAVLHIFLSLITNGQTAALSAEMQTLKRICGERKLSATNLATVAKIVAAIGKISKEDSQEAVSFLMVQCEKCEASCLPVLLKEVEHLAEHWPLSVRPYLPEIHKMGEKTNYLSAWRRIRDLCSENETTRNSLKNLSSSEQLTSSVILSGSSRSQDTLSRRSSPSSLRDSMLPVSSASVTTTGHHTSHSHGQMAQAAPAPVSVTSTLVVPASGTLPCNLSKRKSSSSVNLSAFRRYSSSGGRSTADDSLQANAHHSRSPLTIGHNHYNQDALINQAVNQSPATWRDTSRKPIRLSGQGTYVKHNQTVNNLGGTKSSAAVIQQKQLSSGHSPFVSRHRNNRSVGGLVDEQNQTPPAWSQQPGNSMIVLPVTRPDGTTHEWRYTVQYMPNGRVSLKPMQSNRPHLHAPSGTSTNSSVVTTFNAQSDYITQRTASGSIIVDELFKSNDLPSRPSTSSHQRPVLRVPPSNIHGKGTALAPSPTHSQTSHTPNAFNHNPQVWNSASDESALSLLTKQNSLHRTDAVKQFCEKHRSKIRDYMHKLSGIFPVPVQCTVEEVGGGVGRNRMRVHFGCTARTPHCLYLHVDGPNGKQRLFAFKTRLPHHWLHLMFLQLQAQQQSLVLGQDNEQVQRLKHCWECLPSHVIKNRSFSALVTSAFPTVRDHQSLRKELESTNYFDTFSVINGQSWMCFACSHPDKVQQMLGTDDNDLPVMEGKLKEKRGRWRLFKRWQTKYFTLSGATLTFREHTEEFVSGESNLLNSNDVLNGATIDLRHIRSVRSVSRRSGRKNLPRAFEIFTEDQQSFTLKAQDGSAAEEWLRCLTIAVAQAQKDTQIAQL